MKRWLCVLFFITGSALAIGGCKSSTQTEAPAGNSGVINTTPSRLVTEQTVGSLGGTVNVALPADSLNGLILTIPNGSYSRALDFTISEAHVTSHTFGPNFNPISPLITISNGSGYASQHMILRIPCHIAPGRFAIITRT